MHVDCVQAKRGKSNSLSQGGANKRSSASVESSSVDDNEGGKPSNGQISPAELATRNNGSESKQKEKISSAQALITKNPEASTSGRDSESAQSSGSYVNSTNTGGALVSSGIKLEKVSQIFQKIECCSKSARCSRHCGPATAECCPTSKRLMTSTENLIL